VLYPSDGTSTAKLVAAMADLEGVSFLRSTRANTPVLYDAGDEFPVGGSKVLRRSDADQVTLIGAGITLHEALKAHDQLKGEGIAARVIDLYSVKPIDTETLRQAARETQGLVVVEDHWAEGGLGDAVLDAFAGIGQKAPTVVKLAVREMPTSGKPAELLHAAGIDADCIAKAAKDLVGAGR
jgi:transketolase